ncbi:MAG: DUF1285 domain-containing protein [Sphingorhabdus sp.]
MPYDAPPDLASLSLSEIAEYAAQRKLPPVASWNPEKTADSMMRIAADGRWFHRGGEIKRTAMLRAFSSLLRREEDGSYWLVTPYEKQSIEVEDAPFMAVEMHSEGSGKARKLAFRLSSDDLVVAAREHELEMRGSGDNAVPYLHVRGGLWAKLTRPVYYELAELALSDNSDDPAVWSSGQRFAMGAAS